MTACPNCNAQNRDTARFCRQCGVRLSRHTGIGARLGGEYRVVEVIKAGGMGTVYKAESGGTFYAVKEMRDTFTNPDCYWDRSLAYEAQGRKRDAINDLHQYISIGAETPNVLSGRSLSCRELRGHR